MSFENKPIPDRVLRYDGHTHKGAVPRCLDCRTPLEIEKFDDGYCDEICARTAMMKRKRS